MTKFPPEDLRLSFQDIVEDAKWYEYFTQINVSGDHLGAEAVIGKMIELKLQRGFVSTTAPLKSRVPSRTPTIGGDRDAK